MLKASDDESHVNRDRSQLCTVSECKQGGMPADAAKQLYWNAQMHYFTKQSLIMFPLI